MKVAALIPHYDHAGTLPTVVSAMRAQGLPVLIVDDASPERCRPVLDELARQDEVLVRHLPVNQGKGGAVKAGMAWAHELGYDHVLQVDADAQHALGDAARLLEVARAQPEVVVCAEPVYGDDAPRARLYGRKLTNFWAAINSGSRQIRDGMCGFRIYPLGPVLKLLKEHRTGDRMDFDIEVLVLLVWAGVPLAWVRTPVKYEPGGVSHFHPWRDNLLISLMHARLFFRMLGRRVSTWLRGPR